MTAQAPTPGTPLDNTPLGNMSLGKGIVIAMLAAGLGAGLLVRQVGMQQWELSKQFYREHAAVLAEIDALHRSIRAGLAPTAAAERADALEPRLIAAINGRTYFTLARERDYLDAVRRWKRSEGSLSDVEGAFGVLVGRIALESESLQDAPFRFATVPLPGTVPIVERKRRMM